MPITVTTNLATTTYIGDTAAAAKRNTLADYHLTPIADGLKDNENVFTGFTSTTGFTDVVVTSADELRTAIASQTTSQKRRYLCRWNGVSENTGAAMDGPTSAGYTANGSVDWGYNRPDHSVWITPDAGYTPSIGVNTAVPGKSLSMRGYNWLFFENMGFDCRILFSSNATYPGLVIAAFKGCTFSNLDVDRVGQFRAILGQPARALHIENCTFNNCFGGAAGYVEYLRGWNNSFTDMGPEDIWNASSYGLSGMTSAWTPNVWLFGNTVYDHDTSTRTAGEGSGLHTDFFQCLAPTDGIPALRVLIEFNTVALNASNVSGQPQSQFIQASPGGNANMVVDWIMHNNLAVIAAFNVQNLVDASDSGDKYMLNNTFARHGNPIDLAGSIYNTFPQMTFAKRKRLNFDGQTSPFTVGQRVTGGTSGAIGNVTAVTSDGTSGYIDMSPPTAAQFLDNEAITDPLGGAAVVNGTIQEGPAGSTGILRIRNNVVASITGGVFNNEDIAANLAVDPRTGIGTDPATYFTGNGTWGTTATQGYQTYTGPDIGAANAAAARTAIHAFFQPLTGWNDLSGTKYGVTNPANWPATPQATIA